MAHPGRCRVHLMLPSKPMTEVFLHWQTLVFAFELQVASPTKAILEVPLHGPHTLKSSKGRRQLNPCDLGTQCRVMHNTHR